MNSCFFVWVSMKVQPETRTGGLLGRRLQQRRVRQQREGHRQGDKAHRRQIIHIEMWAVGLDYSRTCLLERLPPRRTFLQGDLPPRGTPPRGPPSLRTPLPRDLPPRKAGAVDLPTCPFPTGEGSPGPLALYLQTLLVGGPAGSCKSGKAQGVHLSRMGPSGEPTLLGTGPLRWQKAEVGWEAVTRCPDTSAAPEPSD